MTTTGSPPVGSRWEDIDGDAFTVTGEPNADDFVPVTYDDPAFHWCWDLWLGHFAKYTRLNDAPATAEFHYPQPGDTWVSATSDIPVTVLGVHTTLELAFGDETPDDPPVRMGIDEFLADYEFGEGAA